MEKFSFKAAVMLLAFSVGITIVSIFYFRSPAAPPDVPEVFVEEPVREEPAADQRAALEMVFVLDTTGSMGGLLEGAKQKIWGIVNEVMQRQSRPGVRVGLVAYRDRGDEYVTQVLPLTSDLDQVYTTLMDFQAGGGGDTPEKVRLALAESLSKAGWSEQRPELAQIIFLVGDAPPKNYPNEPDVLVTAAAAARKNMIVNTIQCGNAPDTRAAWQSIAQRAQGRYFVIAQDGGVETVNTPYDAKLAELGRRIGSTYVAYGKEREELMSNSSVTESKVASSNSNTAIADRTLNKALNKEAYRDDLIQDIEKGKVKAESLKSEELPADLAKLSQAERQAEIEKRGAERKKIREEILELSKRRQEFITVERQKSGKTSGFDGAVQESLSEQLKRRGIQ